jgi:hypothetical protein
MAPMRTASSSTPFDPAGAISGGAVRGWSGIGLISQVPALS